MIDLHSSRSASVGLLVGCVLFGLGSVIVAHVPVGAYAIAFWRLAVAGVIFALLAKKWGQSFPKNWQAYRNAWLAGAFLGLDLALWHESIYAVGVGISTLLNSLQIFWLSAIGWLGFQEKLNKLQLFSLVLAVVGVSMIASPELGQNDHALWGLISGLVSGLMLACSMVFVRKTHQVSSTPIFPLMLHISLGGMAVLFVPALLLNFNNLYPTTWAQVGWIVVYGAVMQCFAWGLIAYAIPLLSLALTGLLLLSEPVAALLIDALFLGKNINPAQWAGAILTLLAIYLGSLKTIESHCDKG